MQIEKKHNLRTWTLENLLYLFFSKMLEKFTKTSKGGKTGHCSDTSLFLAKYCWYSLVSVIFRR